jgi:CheY-like chemotaxis protein
MGIETRYVPDMPDVLADPSQIHQILMNLITNAADASEGHGTIRVEVDVATVALPLVGVSGEVRPGEYVCLVVADDGSGMDAATLDRIFDPFFTTKAPGKGTGLGLSVVHGIVKSHGGGLVVTSSPGAGSRFEIYLPRLARTAPSERPPIFVPQARGHGQRILCIEDELPILLIESEVLESLGFQVIARVDPVGALAVFAADPMSVDAIVTDFAMPGMSGTEFARAALQIRPTIPVFMTSGYLRPDESDEAKRVGVREIFAKPHFVDPLSLALARVFAPDEGV